MTFWVDQYPGSEVKHKNGVVYVRAQSGIPDGLFFLRKMVNMYGSEEVQTGSGSEGLPFLPLPSTTPSSGSADVTYKLLFPFKS